MFVVLASAHDQQAASLVERWSGAQLLTPTDLSERGWIYRASRPEEAIVAIAGRRVRTAEIAGVFTRIPCVMAHELDKIEPADRDYVAAEMHAFLAAWLSSLQCPVVNRPTPGCLAGPGWSPERWINAAAVLGIPVSEIERNTSDEFAPPQDGSAISVIGSTVLGADDDHARLNAMRLAQAVGTTALTLYMRNGELRSASPWIDVTDREVVAALAAHFACRVDVP